MIAARDFTTFRPGQLVTEAVRRSGQLGADHIGQLAIIRCPLDAVDRFIDDFVASLTSSEFADGCPIATVALEAAATPDSLSEAVSSSFTVWIDAFASLLEVGGLDPAGAHDVAIDVLAHVEGAVLLSKALRSTNPLELARRRSGPCSQRANLSSARLDRIQTEFDVGGPVESCGRWSDD